MIYPAHIRKNADNKIVVQPVAEHCINCACYSSEISIAGLKKIAYLAGVLHDIGKNTNVFKAYIRKAANGEAVRRGSVNHTFAGVRFVMKRRHENADKMHSTVSELLAIVIGSHHGLFDCIASGGYDGYKHRMEKEGVCYDEAVRNFQNSEAYLDNLDELFEEANKEIASIIPIMTGYCKSNAELSFALALLARLLLSAVVDADRRDTAEFMYGIDIGGQKASAKLWESCLDVVEEKLSEFTQGSEIDKARNIFSLQCRKAAGLKDGVYRLSVPTGGGKTLASLRYALAAAAEDGKRHIVFVTPLLSVIEQNAAVIRKYIKNDSIVLEHYSNIIYDKKDNMEDKRDEPNRNELLMQAWDSPVIITTLAQLLNTLFSGKISSVRRMNALAESVIVIDEVQSVPINMLSLFNMAVNFLASVCKSKIVLCSATQPCLEKARHSIKFAEPADIIPYDPELWKVFERTEIIDKRKKCGYSAEELADFADECFKQEGSLLLICNKKSQALSLYKKLLVRTSARVFHLSAAMCTRHRIDVIKDISQCLDSGFPIICVSTQLVEAGVDFSFACVIRVSAGLDNIVQSAGRCNRNGKSKKLSPVYIVNIKQENLDRLQEIKRAQSAAAAVLDSFEKNSANFGDSLLSNKSISEYYRQLYSEHESDKQDYPIKNNSTIFELLSENTQFFGHCRSGNTYTFRQAFLTAGKNFKVFEDNTIDVLVPYGESEEIVVDLCSERAECDFAYCKAKLEKVKQFTISLYEYEVKNLIEKKGLAEKWKGNILMLLPEFYSPETGFCIDGNNHDYMQIQ